MDQIHSDNVYLLTPSDKAHPSADALIFKNFNTSFGCAVRVADCMPLFIYKSGRLVGCVHAGWRPLAGGIIQNIFKIIGTDIDIYAGPHICADCFEVGDEVRGEFSLSSRKGRCVSLFDELRYIAKKSGMDEKRVRLLKESEYCSVENDRYLSHRCGDNMRMAAFAFQS